MASSGGHLSQLELLAPIFADDERIWVTFENASVGLAGEDVTFCHSPTTRNVPNLLRNLKLAASLMLRRTPDVIVSTGAGPAVPFFILGRLLGCRTVFVEVYDRIDSKTLTGRIVRPFTDAFLLQWDQQRATYGSGDVVGALY